MPLLAGELTQSPLLSQMPFVTVKPSSSENAAVGRTVGMYVGKDDGTVVGEALGAKDMLGSGVVGETLGASDMLGASDSLGSGVGTAVEFAGTYTAAVELHC